MSEIATILSILGVFLLGAMSPGPSFVVVSRIAVAGERSDGLAVSFREVVHSDRTEETGVT
ncbi:MAG: hypothetical protein E5X66_30140, partial [Mesorhizobium sp.]